MTDKKDFPAVLFENAGKKYLLNSLSSSSWLTVFENLSFSVQQGEAAVLLGLNGTGKTTILKLITGLLFPSSGRITVFGKSPQEPETKSEIGFLPELPYFPPYEKPMSVLLFYGQLSGLKKSDLKEKAEKAIEITGLAPHRNKKISEFSKGMMQRLGLAQAILHEPRLMLLDEPASGLDPLAIRDIRKILSEMSRKGMTILMSSHSISDAEKICGKAIILKNGALARSVSRSEWEQEGGLEEVFIKTASEDLNSREAIR